MDRTAERDREWMRRVVRQYEGPLTIYVARMLGDDDRARDIVQDAFVKLWETDREKIESYLARWLYTVCRNRTIDVCRKEQRMRTLENGQLDIVAPPRSDASASEACPAETHAGVLELVSGLPARQQEVVRLKFQGGLSYREMAEVMNTTVNNVGVLLHTAIKTIRIRMAEAAEMAKEMTGEKTDAAQAGAAR